ncbi:hypothetical protein [Thiomicrorhabdus aquaedulcis]|uniref:hypothetical protein n=1 Tax=Thiomicrorhabdus aquaedulcis TaxID=2211106 RepID=UPI001561CAA9|nr:hypothetical protein [Thiomicrorhabdus aquaedulcis]
MARHDGNRGAVNKLAWLMLAILALRLPLGHNPVRAGGFVYYLRPLHESMHE